MYSSLGAVRHRRLLGLAGGDELCDSVARFEEVHVIGHVLFDAGPELRSARGELGGRRGEGSGAARAHSKATRRRDNMR